MAAERHARVPVSVLDLVFGFGGLLAFKVGVWGL